MKTLFAAWLAAALLAVSSSAPSAQRATAVSVGTSSYRGPHYASSRVWIPGSYEYVCQRVWVPGQAVRVWNEPVFEIRRDHCGGTYRVLIRAGYWSIVTGAGHFETRRVPVWRPGRWVARGGY